jgi:hypothetical protein
VAVPACAYALCCAEKATERTNAASTTKLVRTRDFMGILLGFFLD